MEEAIATKVRQKFLISKIIKTTPPQICYPNKDKTILFCNWVHHPRMPGFRIFSLRKKKIPVEIDKTTPSADTEGKNKTVK